MKLQLLAIQTQEKPKNATAHFKKCPACGNKNLIELEPEVLCGSCDWTSCSWSVSRGAMDNLHAAAAQEMRIDAKIERKRQKKKEKDEARECTVAATAPRDLIDAS